MGLQTEWKAVLEETYGYCRTDGVPDGTEIDVVIDDGSLAVRRTVHSVESWTQFGEQIRMRIASFYSPSLKRYVITFDERRHVPVSKQPEQEKRRASALAQGIIPLSEAELARLVIERDYALPEPKQQFVKRLMNTSGAQAPFFAFCTAEIVSVQFPSPPPPTRMDLDDSSLYADADTGVPPVGVHVIVDGGRVSLLDERRKNGKSNARFLLETAEYLAHTPGCIYVLPGERPSIRVEPSLEIGEGDLKIVKHISMLEGGNVYVRSCDTDMIVILLLNMRRWINRDTGKVRYGIFLDTTSNAAAAAAGKNVIDVVSLWRSILTYFQDKYPGIPCPIETMCLLMLLSGGDYAEGFSQLGPRRLWSAFCNGGHEILFGGSEHIRVPAAHAQKQPPSDHAIILAGAVDSYGVDSQRYGLTFNENQILHFITYSYLRSVSTISSREAAATANMRSVRHLVAGKGESARTRWKLVSDDEMRAVVRRVWWWMDYLMNGALDKRQQPFLDPILVHPESGLSLYGWEEAKEQEQQQQAGSEKTVRVTRAKTVHVNRLATSRK